MRHHLSGSISRILLQEKYKHVMFSLDENSNHEPLASSHRRTQKLSSMRRRYDKGAMSKVHTVLRAEDER